MSIDVGYKLRSYKNVIIRVERRLPTPYLSYLKTYLKYGATN